jgi:hypothetical protein
MLLKCGDVHAFFLPTAEASRRAFASNHVDCLERNGGQ